MSIETPDMEHRHRDALRRIYQAEKIWADRGNQPRSFMLLHRGGMRSEVDHPTWDPSWAVPSEHTIDDLAELSLLRVEPSHNKARTFVLSMNGRQRGAALIAETPVPNGAPPKEYGASTDPSGPAPEPAGSADAPSVFVSWAHSGEQWQETIGDFTVQLRRLGIAADVDLFEAHNPDVNWATYGPQAIERNDFVIIAVNPAYRERWEANNDPHTGSGAAREANVLKGLFNRDQDAFYSKVKIVILPGADSDDIPTELLAAPQRFEIAEISPDGLEDLIRTLTGQPAFPRPTVGQVPVLPPKLTDQPSGENTPSGEVAELRQRLLELERTLTAPSDSRQDPSELAAERTTVRAALGVLASEATGHDTQEPPTLPERRMLDVLYEAFTIAGDWPRFQYVTARLWEELGENPREVYYQLSEHGFVHPAIPARQSFQLREETEVAVSLLGLTHLRAATQDIANFVGAVRYIAGRAVKFRPSTPTEVEHLTVTSEEVRLHLAIDAGDPALLRLRSLIREEAWNLRTSFGSQEDGPWSMVVIPEAARRFNEIHTIIDFMALSAGGAR
jgi:SEFIR domain